MWARQEAVRGLAVVRVQDLGWAKIVRRSMLVFGPRRHRIGKALSSNSISLKGSPLIMLILKPWKPGLDVRLAATSMKDDGLFTEREAGILQIFERVS